MEEEQYEAVKSALLGYIQELFEEREQELAVSHQEQYAMLEDMLENAVDLSELKVAFEQWHVEYADDMELDQDVDELWQVAVAEAGI